MTDDRSADAEPPAEAPQRESETIEMTTKFDPALRTDKRIAGTVIVFFSLFLAAFGLSSGEYPLFVTGSLLAFAVLVVLLLVPYDALRDTW
jgi:hypothetical protein